MFAFYTLLALLSTLQAYVADVKPGQTMSWGPLVRQEFKMWYTCGLVSLAVLWFCGWNRLQKDNTRRWVAIHFLAAVVFAVFYGLLTSFVVAGDESVMHPGMTLTFSYLLRVTGLHYCVVYLLMYWVMVFAHLGWHYYQRYCEREVLTAELQRELVEARLSALRMQLNPHFLFNTLHAVSALMHENTEAADRVISRLSELLRMSLDQSKPQEVPLAEEMAFLDRYLEIEQTRFADRLTVHKEIEAEAEDALVPYLILQPLVENAIRHGIEPREEPGLVAIEARRHSGRLELKVRDNGPGFPGNGKCAPPEGIGLSNTRSRLSHLYGDDFVFELSGGAAGGLEARIEIPFRTGKQQARELGMTQPALT
jgi:two-component sensor histidine kinase